MYEYYGDFAEVEGYLEGMAGLSLISNLWSITVSVAVYVFMAIGMYSIAKRRGIHNPWLAWIPFGSSWMLGCISDQYRYVVKGQEKAKRKAMLALDIATTAVAVVAIVMLVVSIVRIATDGKLGMPEGAFTADAAYISGVLQLLMGSMGLCFVILGLTIALMVLRYMALYDLYTSCNPANGALFTVLSIILGGIAQAVFVFVCRNKDFGMPPRQPQTPNESPVWQPLQPPVEPWEMNQDH